MQTEGRQAGTRSPVKSGACNTSWLLSRRRPLRLQPPALCPVLPPVGTAAGLAAVAHCAAAAAALEAARGTAARGGTDARRAGAGERCWGGRLQPGLGRLCLGSAAQLCVLGLLATAVGGREAVISTQSNRSLPRADATQSDESPLEPLTLLADASIGKPGAPPAAQRPRVMHSGCGLPGSPQAQPLCQPPQ